MKRELVASFLLCATFGFLIWTLSRVITGTAEPWDSNSWYYVGAITGAGLVAGFLFPNRLWPVITGVAAGQAVYMLLFVAKGATMLVGVIALFVYGLPALGAAFVASRLRRFIQRSGRETDVSRTSIRRRD